MNDHSSRQKPPNRHPHGHTHMHTSCGPVSQHGEGATSIPTGARACGWGVARARPPGGGGSWRSGWALPGQEAMPGSGFQSEGSERSRPDCTGYSGADFLLAAILTRTVSFPQSLGNARGSYWRVPENALVTVNQWGRRLTFDGILLHRHSGATHSGAFLSPPAGDRVG